MDEAFASQLFDVSGDGAKDSSDVLQAAATSYGTLSNPSAGRNTSLSAVLQIVSPSRRECHNP